MPAIVINEQPNDGIHVATTNITDNSQKMYVFIYFPPLQDYNKGWGSVPTNCERYSPIIFRTSTPTTIYNHLFWHFFIRIPVDQWLSTFMSAYFSESRIGEKIDLERNKHCFKIYITKKLQMHFVRKQN